MQTIKDGLKNVDQSVSVCLVTFNRARLLPATIDSILAQSFTDFEFIISDDCSTDGTEEICLEYAKRDSRIKYIRNHTNLGMPGNLNSSMQAATGNYLANLHDGDIYRNDLIEKWKTALDTYSTAGFVFNAYRANIDPTKPEVVFREPYPPLIKGSDLGYRLLARWDSCVFGTVMARRSVYENLNWFDPEFGNFSDVDMWLRITKTWDVAYLDECLIELMPKDTTRFYAFPHWKVSLWLLGIHKTNLKCFKDLLPNQVSQLEMQYPQRRRKFLIFQMLLCIKHRRWDRVREGLAVWRDADDLFLKTVGRILGKLAIIPDWYHKDAWAKARISPKNS